MSAATTHLTMLDTTTPERSTSLDELEARLAHAPRRTSNRDGACLDLRADRVMPRLSSFPDRYAPIGGAANDDNLKRTVTLQIRKCDAVDDR
jgi:hypothetical protein